MPENMSISVNGQSQVPPGFRFHPTEEELLQYYLRKKVSYEKIDLDVIRDVDLNKLEPWDIQERCKIGTTPQNDWYFFSHKDKKYPTGTRTNRATAAGFWKATGRDKVIYSNGRRIGMRKTLVFYKGRAPHGQKSDWIMHEYRLDDHTVDSNVSVSNTIVGEGNQEEGWVVCRIFKKKNFHKTLDSPMRSSIIPAETRSQMLISSCNEGALEQVFQYMGRVCKEDYSEENNNIPRFLRTIDTTGYHDGSFMKLPSLESPNSTRSQNCYRPLIADHNDVGPSSNQVSNDPNLAYHIDSGLTNWAVLDRLVASQLNGQTESSRQLVCFSTDPTSMGYFGPTDHHELQLPTVGSSSSNHGTSQEYNSEIELWNFTRSSSSSMSSSDSLGHVVMNGAGA